MGNSPPLLKAGTRLDRYELVCPVGQGGMASVWVARLRGKRGFENLVAIKTVLPQHAGDAAFEGMFVDEARIVAGIRHPNVASVLDVGEANGLLYLVFEWVQGERLSMLSGAVKGTGMEFDVPIALRIMADTCAGLHAAHELCDTSGAPLMIVHRDVSPQNIMVTTTGCAKVIDFGVAKAIHRLSGNTDAGVIKGKLSYLSPEMARGEPADRRSDVWAAGVVLYELLAGRLPVQGETKEATVLMIGRGAAPEPLPTRVPPSIAAIVSRALANSPDQRFQTAGEMHRALESALAKESRPVTCEDVAAWLGKHLGAHIDHRARTIAGALESCRRGEPAPPVDDDSYPSVSIGESSISEMIFPDDEPEVRPAAQPSPGARRRLQAILAIALPFALIATLAILLSTRALRTPASAGARATLLAPAASSLVPTQSSASPVPQTDTVAAAEMVAPSASASQEPVPPKTPQLVPVNPNDPRVIFGWKR